jgi:hypothetical protein
MAHNVPLSPASAPGVALAGKGEGAKKKIAARYRKIDEDLKAPGKPLKSKLLARRKKTAAAKRKK